MVQQTKCLLCMWEAWVQCLAPYGSLSSAGCGPTAKNKNRRSTKSWAATRWGSMQMANKYVYEKMSNMQCCWRLPVATMSFQDNTPIWKSQNNVGDTWCWRGRWSVKCSNSLLVRLQLCRLFGIQLSGFTHNCSVYDPTQQLQSLALTSMNWQLRSTQKSCQRCT